MSDDKHIPRSLPIPIADGRRRSGSDSDSSTDSGSTSPASPAPTPASGTLPRISPISPSASPILSYFLSNQSPKSPSSTFPFRRSMAGPPLFEDDDLFEADKPIRHGRRASAAAWPGHDRFPPVVPLPNDQQERAAGLLRRLSLGGNAPKPPVAPVPKQTATNAIGSSQAPRSKTPPDLSSKAAGAAPTSMRKARRANTLAPGTPRPARAPSPMGERILKGHFDGFN